jgi:hypothetical protein
MINDEIKKHIPLLEHPHRNKIERLKCSKKGCALKRQVVTYFEINVHIWSGDSNGSYSVLCENCGKEISRSFSD